MREMPPSDEGGGKTVGFDGGREGKGTQPVDSENRPYDAPKRTFSLFAITFCLNRRGRHPWRPVSTNLNRDVGDFYPLRCNGGVSTNKNGASKTAAPYGALAE